MEKLSVVQEGEQLLGSGAREQACMCFLGLEQLFRSEQREEERKRGAAGDPASAGAGASPSSDAESPYGPHLRLALALASQHGLLADVCETALSADVLSAPTWYTLSLALLSVRQYARASRALARHIELQPLNSHALSLAAKVATERLGDPSRGLQLARRAAGASSGHGRARALQLAAASLVELARAARPQASAAPLLKRALQDLCDAAVLAGGADANIEYQTGLVLAVSSRTGAAFSSAQRCLALQRTHLEGSLLLSLLFTSRQQYGAALGVATTCAAEWPDSPRVLLLVAALQEVVLAGEFAQQTLLRARLLVCDSDDEAVSTSRFAEGLLGYADHGRSFAPISPRVAAALLSSRLAQRAGNLHAADAAIEEASVEVGSETHPFIWHERGRLAEARGHDAAAATMYAKGVAINPFDAGSLTRLGTRRLAQSGAGGGMSSAPRLLRQALAADCTSAEAWQQLGTALLEGQQAGASESFLAACRLESEQPLVPFEALGWIE